MVAFELGIHSLLNTVSGLFLIIIGGIVLQRNKSNRLNQLLALFFWALAIFELFDGFTVAFRADPSIGFLNTLRDVAVIGLLLSLGLAFLASMILNYGENSVFKIERLLLLGILLGVAIIGGLLGDLIPEAVWHGGHAHFHTAVDRELYAFLAVTGSIVLFSAIIIYSLLSIVRQTEDAVKRKLRRLLIGFSLMFLIILVFDLSFFVTELRNIILNSSDILSFLTFLPTVDILGVTIDFQANLFHILLHVVLFIGELFVLAAFWTPVESVQATSATPTSSD